ncbi:hypothetical protein C8J57DRAFT_1251319 [Mycena rebaudengoi]|nr:hypothetical protein C8J57DRAFT_1251319 [Mycena rebaudengoi]
MMGDNIYFSGDKRTLGELGAVDFIRRLELHFHASNVINDADKNEEATLRFKAILPVDAWWVKIQADAVHRAQVATWATSLTAFNNRFKGAQSMSKSLSQRLTDLEHMQMGMDQLSAGMVTVGDKKITPMVDFVDHLKDTMAEGSCQAIGMRWRPCLVQFHKVALTSHDIAVWAPCPPPLLQSWPAPPLMRSCCKTNPQDTRTEAKKKGGKWFNATLSTKGSKLKLRRRQHQCTPGLIYSLSIHRKYQLMTFQPQCTVPCCHTTKVEAWVAEARAEAKAQAASVLTGVRLFIIYHCKDS